MRRLFAAAIASMFVVAAVQAPITHAGAATQIDGAGSTWSDSQGISVGVLGMGMLRIDSDGVVNSPVGGVAGAVDPITHAVNPAGNGTVVYSAQANTGGAKGSPLELK